MGVTIHFEGRLANDVSIDRVVEVAREYAKHQGWRTDEVNEASVTLQRVREEEPQDYTGPVRGLVLHPHEWSDPVRLEFDETRYIQDFAKTQFAGGEVHTQVIELLDSLQPYFATLAVDDEGEYWGTRDLDALSRHLSNTSGALEDYLREHPGSKGPVKLESGRIVDIIE